ncbi:ABC transporter permease [Mesorhizobium sp. CO1-1-11]|uniref:ABC transporter permease n=1 Tax=Mesorhizobium sp. CO1-1-11 TaxID=2876636 RepID=UPI001CCFBF47|nr:ABC transporter permease [Mesorhizobium sp. CO1-1-11]MBZ9726320.1 ABC transporter permease [Mesorhizobium sp. CO1-1-11]
MNEAPLRRFIFGSLTLFCVVFLTVPTVIVVISSFNAGNILQFPPDGLSLRWYRSLASQTDIQSAVIRSLYVATICTVLSIPVGTLAALAMNRYRIRFLAFVRLYLLLPFTIPVVVSGISLLILYGEMNLVDNLWGVGVALCAINLPFMIWAVAASVNALDFDLENAAANLGAPPLQSFLFVTVPAVTPGIVTGALLMFILAMNEFVVSLLLVSKRTMTLPVQLFLSIRSNVTPDVAAVAVIYIVISALAIVTLDRLVGLDLFLKSRITV